MSCSFAHALPSKGKGQERTCQGTSAKCWCLQSILPSHFTLALAVRNRSKPKRQALLNFKQTLKTPQLRTCSEYSLKATAWHSFASAACQDAPTTALRNLEMLGYRHSSGYFFPELTANFEEYVPVFWWGAIASKFAHARTAMQVINFLCTFQSKSFVRIHAHDTRMMVVSMTRDLIF